LNVLFFELFPLFMLFVCGIVLVCLVVADRQARQIDEE
jgi:hypothetical protein